MPKSEKKWEYDGSEPKEKQKEKAKKTKRMRESHRWVQIKKATGRASRDTLKGKP